MIEMENCCKNVENNSVYWNPYNKVVQCHSCGHVYVKQDLKQSEAIKLAIYETTLLRNSVDASPHSNVGRRFNQIIDILNEGLEPAQSAIKATEQPSEAAAEE